MDLVANQYRDSKFEPGHNSEASGAPAFCSSCESIVDTATHRGGTGGKGSAPVDTDVARDGEMLVLVTSDNGDFSVTY